MVTWILLALVIYYVGVFLPGLFLLPNIGIMSYLGSRDADPDPSVHQARAQRATRNFQENLAPFLGLGALALVVPNANMDQAVLGAQLFVLARLVYVPLYLFAVPVARSVAYTVGFVGLIKMGLALI